MQVRRSANKDSHTLSVRIHAIFTVTVGRLGVPSSKAKLRTRAARVAHEVELVTVLHGAAHLNTHTARRMTCNHAFVSVLPNYSYAFVPDQLHAVLPWNVLIT